MSGSLAILTSVRDGPTGDQDHKNDWKRLFFVTYLSMSIAAQQCVCSSEASAKQFKPDTRLINSLPSVQTARAN